MDQTIYLEPIDGGTELVASLRESPIRLKIKIEMAASSTSANPYHFNFGDSFSLAH